jgi:hypothetical protein
MIYKSNAKIAKNIGCIVAIFENLCTFATHINP